MSPTHAATPAVDLAEVELADVLQALSDPVRLEIVRQLYAQTECTCGQLELPVSKSTGSHHLKQLAAAGIIAQRGEGTRKHLSLRRDEFEQRFPGLLDSVLRAVGPGYAGPSSSS